MSSVQSSWDLRGDTSSAATTFEVQPYYLEATYSYGVASARPADAMSNRAAEAVKQVALEYNAREAPGSAQQWHDLVQEAVARAEPCDAHKDLPINIRLLPFATSMQTGDLVWYNEARKAHFMSGATRRGILVNVLGPDGSYTTTCPDSSQVGPQLTGQDILHAYFDPISERAGITFGSDAASKLAAQETPDDKLTYLSWRITNEANEVMRETGHSVKVEVLSRH